MGFFKLQYIMSNSHIIFQKYVETKIYLKSTTQLTGTSALTAFVLYWETSDGEDLHPRRYDLLPKFHKRNMSYLLWAPWFSSTRRTLPNGCWYHYREKIRYKKPSVRDKYVSILLMDAKMCKHRTTHVVWVPSNDSLFILRNIYALWYMQ